MRFLKPYLLLLAVMICSVATAAEKQAPLRVLGSIERIHGPLPPPYKDFVRIIVTIHSPVQLLGVQLDLVTASQDRGRVRAEFPLGSLYILTLPSATIVELTNQRKHQELIEKTVDGGTPPEMISDAVTITQLRMADLTTPPLPFAVKP